MSPAVLDRAFEWVFSSGLVRDPFTVLWHAGEPLVILHGAYMNIPSMGEIIPTLARTHRVLALSLPGHGDSAPAVDGYAPGRDLARTLRHPDGIPDGHA